MKAADDAALESFKSNNVCAHLEQKLDSLDGGYSCFGDGCGNATGQEVLGEGNSGVSHLCCGQSSVGFACGVEMADSNLEERAFKKTQRESARELRLFRLIGWPRQQWAGLVDVL